MYRFGVTFGLALLCGRVFAAFGLEESNSTYKVDTDGGLIFEVDRSNGDIVSLLFNDVQYQGTTKMSQINSGLGSSTVTAETVNGIVKITVQAGSQPLTHYYVAKPKDPTIYMATHITGEIKPGELRWLARLQRKQVPTGVHGDVANLDGCQAFEGKDTFKCPDGTTRCKMYTSDRFIDDKVHGVTGEGVGVWMIMPGNAYEHSSGGPFMRDINSQSGGDQELYWYMNSGHVRTEPWRLGLLGPYAMRFTTGEKPSDDLDVSFFDSLDIKGYVADSGRGSVSGTAGGVAGDFETVVHWFNEDAQYWTKATDGKFTSPLMKPGTYTTKVYRNEFPVANGTVVITAGGKATQDIASTESKPSVIWRIGEFDGRPSELKNGDKIERMHPSDTRMAPWGGEFTVGKSQANEFPMALFSKVGGNATVQFDLTADQLQGVTLRVGTTLSFKGGRPNARINDWQAPDPGAPTLIDSRGVTRGAYRGFGDVYTWDVPAGELKQGANTLTLGVFGNGDKEFLSANYVIDAVELQGKAGAGSP
ncbi:rhamnogalacturonase B [Colletotrichum higginsianum]|uniref:rhamnogalacturonan endolyase n=2 Tax=Colletotrichum higginsianum TaxID=80884 RepID=H1UW67_COLHI|nr:Rhamnogalacturonase B [Colletotrichum higginsianum IMI 349063]OBR11084.1 Rhamnogalacturonase B [Colletotrichum higginsianum IMI 349063]TIC91266.1 Rhamnogalacturonate lyase A [Colletotrichum higginsianum]CCF32218.1 rhamnogalacturonase B [Colletotrichum higginsianum]